jgi:hypothetical protein
MSNSSLSLLSMSKLSLPALPPTSFIQPLSLQTLQYLKKKLELPEADSVLFTASFFSCTLLDTSPATVQLNCLQLRCSYTLKLQPLSYK